MDASQGIFRQRPGRLLAGLGDAALVRRAARFTDRNRRELAVLGLFLALTLVITYPLVLRLTSHIPICCDAWMYYWYTWWTKKAMLGLQHSQFYTDFIYYPTGTSLSFEGLYNSILGAVLWPVFGGVLSFNLLFLSTYVLGAFGTYLLVVRLTGDWRAGVLAGVIFVFSPVRSQYLTFPNISTIQWIPFLALWSLKTIDRPTIRNALLSALFFALVVLSSGYYAVSAVFMLAIIGAWRARAVLNRDFARALGVFAAASAALVTPFIYPALREALSGESVLRNSFLTPDFSADLLSFLVPPRANPIYSPYVAHIYDQFRTHFTEWESYVGVVTAALMAFGVARSGRRAWMWLSMFLVFVVISLGPYLQVLGEQFQNVRLPFYFLQELPVIESMRSPKRFLVTAMLAAAVLAGLGGRSLFRRLDVKTARRWPACLLALVLVGLILTDYWGWPRTLVTSDASYPRYFDEMAQDQRDVVVLNIPVTSLVNPQPMYYQTIHGKKMVGGYVERPRPEAVEQVQDNAFLRGITLFPGLEPKQEITPEEEQAAFRLFSQYPEIEYVVFMKSHFFYPELHIFDVYRSWLEGHFGGPVYEDGLAAVFRVDHDVVEAQAEGQPRPDPDR